MKLKYILLIIITAICCTTRYANAQTKDNFNEPKNGNILIVYFSKTGNTRQVAEYIQSSTGGNLVELKTINEYPQEYHAATITAKQEKETNARPVLKTKIDNIDKYDIIFIGFPIWWSYTPMAIATFLESYDLSGKKIIPFCTHGGGGVGEAFNYIRELTPNCSYSEGFVSYDGHASSIKSNIDKWLKGINVID